MSKSTPYKVYLTPFKPKLKTIFLVCKLTTFIMKNNTLLREGNNTPLNKDNFSYSFKTSTSPEDVFGLLLNIEKWWSGLHGETIRGESRKIGDEFIYEAGGGAHNSKQQLQELIPNQRVVWLVTESRLNFLNDPGEWTSTRICFDISRDENQTIVTFTHEGLMPQIECYDQCSFEWKRYLEKFRELLIEGPGNTVEVASRFNELAKQEKWFEIQEELFSENVKSIDPPNSPYFGYAEGKSAVRQKGVEFGKKIEAVHRTYTSNPVVGGNHFAVAREVDITLKGFGRIQLNQVMLYEVNGGQIVSEQFFY